MSDTDYMPLTTTEWRIKHPRREWSEWKPYINGSRHGDLVVEEMKAEVRRYGGPTQMVYRAYYGSMESEVRVVRTAELDQLHEHASLLAVGGATK